MEAAEQIRELTKLLEEANYQYYVLDDPKMEDYEYDRLMRQLEELAELTHARVFDGREDLIGAFRSVKGYN